MTDEPLERRLDTADDMPPAAAALFLLRGINADDDPSTITLTLAAAQVLATLAVAEEIEALVRLERRRQHEEGRLRRQR